MLLILFAACNSTNMEDEAPENPEFPFIRFTLDGLTSGKAYLYGTYMDQQFIADSSEIDPNGQIKFQREMPYPSGHYYLTLPGQPPLQLLLTNDQSIHFSANILDPIRSIKVEGSLENELLYRDLTFNLEIQPKMIDINQKLRNTPRNSQEYLQINEDLFVLLEEQKSHEEKILAEHPESFFAKFKRASRNPPLPDVRKPDGSIDNEKQVILFRNQYWDEVDFSDSRLLRTNVIANKLNTYMTQLTIQHADSINKSASSLIDKVLNYPAYYAFFLDWITGHYDVARTTIMDPDAVFHYMITNYLTYERVTWLDSAEIFALQIRAADMAKSLVGNKAPDIRAKDPSGKFRSISEITSPYIIVFLYNPTCDHCIEETPKLLEFHREWKSKGVEVFAVAIETEEADWLDFINQNQTQRWINVFDPTNQVLYRTYYIDKTPEIYVLNPDRIIIAKNLKVHQIEPVIRQHEL